MAGNSEQPAYDPQSRGAQLLRSLGLEALVEIIETIRYGVCITGEGHTWTYLNPAGSRIIGARFEDLEGRDYLLNFAEHERYALLALEHKQREGDTGSYRNTVVRPDGSEQQMVWTGTVVTVAGRELAPAIFHEVSDVRSSTGQATELGAAAARLASGRHTHDVLGALVQEAVEATRGEAAVMLLADPSGLLRVAASYGVAPALADAVRRSPARLDELPAGELLARGRSGFLHDARDRLEATQRTRPWVRATHDLAWRGAAEFPVHQDGRPLGALIVLAPDRLTAPSESEMALWSHLAGQGEIALRTDRIRSEVSHTSTVLERERIARDLHDSVNHAIFALHARAQAVERALEQDKLDLARQAATGLSDLARQASGEMRELLSELREQEAGRTADLPTALRELADAVTSRDGLGVELAVDHPDLPALPAAVVEHMVRIAGEALHNTAKHADARRATVAVDVADGELVLVVSDDGRGFDPATSTSGHGQRTMRERAALVGGTVDVASTPGEGTAVVVRLPVPALTPDEQ